MLTLDQGRAIAGLMADRLFEAMRGGTPTAQGASLLRHRSARRIAAPVGADPVLRRRVGVHLRQREPRSSAISARCWRRKSARASKRSARGSKPSIEGIRATVVGASQYTIQLSGSTIYVSPLDALPLRNVPVIAPALPLDGETIDPAAVARAIAGDAQAARSRRRRDSRSRCSCRGRARRRSSGSMRSAAAWSMGLRDVLARGHPLVLAGDGDVGGLIGIHLREEMKIENPIVSIDGLELKEFDYIDIGAMLEGSGAVPVVIKSLIFPGNAAAERPREALRRSVEPASRSRGRLLRRPAAAGRRPRSRRPPCAAAHGRCASEAEAEADRMQRRASRDKASAVSSGEPCAGNSRRARSHGTARTADQRRAQRKRRPQRERNRSAEHDHRTGDADLDQGSATPLAPSSAPTAITAGTSAAAATSPVGRAARPRGRPPPSPAYGRGRERMRQPVDQAAGMTAECARPPS